MSNYVLATNNGPELGDFRINRGGYASIRAGGGALRRTKDRPIDGGSVLFVDHILWSGVSSAVTWERPYH